MSETGLGKTGFAFIDNTDSDFIKYYTRMMKLPYSLSKQEMELYSIMHNRWTLSKYKAYDGDTHFLDEQGNFYFTLERDQIVKYIGCRKTAFVDMKNVLVDKGLLREVARKGYASRYYLVEYDEDGGVKDIIDEYEKKT